MSLLTMMQSYLNKPANLPAASETSNQNNIQKEKPITEPAANKVYAIMDQAMAKGWSVDQLCQNQSKLRFPLGNDYGLVCFVGDNREIGEINENYIEIIHSYGRGQKSILKFYNNRILQDWIRKVEVLDEQ